MCVWGHRFGALWDNSRYRPRSDVKLCNVVCRFSKSHGECVQRVVVVCDRSPPLQCVDDGHWQRLKEEIKKRKTKLQGVPITVRCQPKKEYQTHKKSCLRSELRKARANIQQAYIHNSMFFYIFLF